MLKHDGEATKKVRIGTERVIKPPDVTPIALEAASAPELTNLS